MTTSSNWKESHPNGFSSAWSFFEYLNDHPEEEMKLVNEIARDWDHYRRYYLGITDEMYWKVIM